MNNNAHVKREHDIPAANFGTHQYTAEEMREVGGTLKKYLGPEYVSARTGPGGSKVHYLEGWKATALANDIFEFNGWSSSIVDLTPDFVDIEHGRVSVGISVIVRITLKDGTYHEDVGYGSIENAKTKAAAFEKAKKEAVTDAIKRALKHFGNALGSCVYDKQYIKQVSRMSTPTPTFDVNKFHRHPDVVRRPTVPPVSAPIIKQEPNFDDSFGDDSLLFGGDMESVDPRLLVSNSPQKLPPNQPNFNGNNNGPHVKPQNGPQQPNGQARQGPALNVTPGANRPGPSGPPQHMNQTGNAAPVRNMSAPSLTTPTPQHPPDSNHIQAAGNLPQMKTLGGPPNHLPSPPQNAARGGPSNVNGNGNKPPSPQPAPAQFKKNPPPPLRPPAPEDQQDRPPPPQCQGAFNPYAISRPAVQGGAATGGNTMAVGGVKRGHESSSMNPPGHQHPTTTVNNQQMQHRGPPTNYQQGGPPGAGGGHGGGNGVGNATKRVKLDIPGFTS
ncbi:DNA repair protein rad52 [Rhizophlyctis rosea]|uniref:DNA repair protein rad52 n=1 Tax=Rhizophlyctis rosea TaxID=64517 RepID=A0AAD5S7B6_9FUNG|nr:DNA repair protein rad52 [Rhizophlyctis rosea]